MDKIVEFSEWLEKERSQRDWSRSDLARAMGVDTAVVSNIMNGVRGIGTDSCRAIARALGVFQLEVFTRGGLIEPVQNHDYESERLIALYRSLPEEKRQAAFMMMQGLHGSGYKKTEIEKNKEKNYEIRDCIYFIHIFFPNRVPVY